MTIFGKSPAKRPPNVVFILVDTLRACHLSFTGYQRETSPRIDEFSNEAVRFRRAITSAPWTPPSVASMFTGLYPSSHRMIPPRGRKLAKRESAILANSHQTLAELYAAAGYQTVGVTPNPWLRSEFGYRQGFATYKLRPYARANNVTDMAIAELEKTDPDKPLFLFVHYLDPHSPYDPPPPYDAMFTGASPKHTHSAQIQDQVNRYDGEIRFMDVHLGRFLDHLRQKPWWNDSITVMISDHGEQFAEHGDVGHGKALFNEELKVLLLLRAPGLSPHDVRSVTSPVDLLPTLANLTNIQAPPEQIEGISLIDETALAARPGVLSEVRRARNWKALVRNDRKKIILDFASAKSDPDREPRLVGVFDRNTDPDEVNPITSGPIVQNLLHDFNTIYERVKLHKGTAERVSVSDETLKQLESLGYLK